MFIKILEAWRAEGKLEGLELTRDESAEAKTEAKTE
jgi:hypothetical protein